MTATSATKESASDKDETKPLTKKGIFLPPGTIPEEEQDTALENVVASPPITIVPSISRITTQTSLLNQRSWDGKK